MNTSNDSHVLQEKPSSGQAIPVPRGCCLELLQGDIKKLQHCLNASGPKLFFKK